MVAAAEHIPVSTSHQRWTLTRALVAGFGILLIVAVLVVLGFSLVGGLATTTDLVGERAKLLLTSIDASTRRHLNPARAQAESIGAQMESGTLSLNDAAAVETALRASLAAAPQLAGTFYIPRDMKNVIEVERIDGKFISRVVDWTDNAVAVSAMRDLAQLTKGFWGEFVYNRENNHTVLNYRRPVRIGGEMVGAIATIVTTAELSDFIRELVGSDDVTAFILVDRTKLLAHTDLSTWPLGGSEVTPLPRLEDIPDPVLREIWNDDAKEVRSFRRIPDADAHRLKIDDVEHVYVYWEYAASSAQPWLIGVHLESQTVLAEFKRIATAAVAAAIVVILALGGVVLLGQRLSRPVLRLAGAAVQVSEHGPHAIEPLPGSRIREINTASKAFDSMVSGLREREQIRETFGRYVPDALVDRMIGDRGVLGPQSRETTTLFTDIVGFSTVSEVMTPTELIGMLNEYFAVVADPIDRHGGVIHQFQGDAILATFNSPTDLEDHQAHAIEAALEIQALVEKVRFASGVELGTRIGINTGEAVCGTVGSGNRLGFTVHGDEVNLAARLEQMNKELGTRILVSEATVEAVQDRFEFTRVGEVPVRGRAAPVVVYRVAGPHTKFETLA